MIINYWIVITITLSVLLDVSKSWDVALTAADEVLFYENGTKINSHKGDFKELVGLTYDAFHKRLFLIDYNRNAAAAIYSLSLKNREVTMVTSQKGFIHDVAYDPNTDQLFWTNIKTKGIYFKPLRSLDKIRMVFLDFETHETPVSIAVDTCRGYVYWTNWAAKFSIQRARIDGLNREVVNDEDLHYPNALVIDQRTRRLFWVDTTEDDHYFISCADLNGDNKQTLVSGYKNIPIDMSVSVHSLFWVDESATHIWKVRKEKNRIPYIYREIVRGNAVYSHYTIDEQTKGIPECRGLRQLYKNVTVEMENKKRNRMQKLQLAKLQHARAGHPYGHNEAEPVIVAEPAKLQSLQDLSKAPHPQIAEGYTNYGGNNSNKPKFSKFLSILIFLVMYR